MNILSINFNHDGSGVILSDGRTAGYVNTERFSRRKKHPGLREADLIELLDQAGVSLADLDHVILCNLHNMDSPDVVTLHGSTLKETWVPFTLDERQETVTIDGHSVPCTVNPEHHRLHCALAYYTSPFDSAVAMSIDPGGWCVHIGRQNRLEPFECPELTLTANMAYTFVATRLFGTGILGAGKVMGLAPYGESVDQSIDYDRLETMEDLYRVAAERPAFVSEGERTWNAALAYHVQHALELQLTRALQLLNQRCRALGIEPHLCLSGGTALNSVANQIAFADSGFARLHLHPASGDDGTAIGAALWYWHDRLDRPRRRFTNAELMYGVRDYDERIEQACHAFGDDVCVEEEPDYCRRVARLIADGKIVAWFQGASEIGPRALGNRSILADPRRASMKDTLNRRVKFRESFRPFAPAVLNDHALSWFGLEDSPFMLRVARVLRPGIPAVTHVDGTARLQTVTAEDNPAFHGLIQCFHEETGVPVVLNTSFNVAGEPIVETPEDAMRSFLRSDMDCLVLGHRLVFKAGVQPDASTPSPAVADA